MSRGRYKKKPREQWLRCRANPVEIEMARKKASGAGYDNLSAWMRWMLLGQRRA